MQLTDEQKRTVRGWVDRGLGLSEIQKLLRDELGVALTYMDVRFLVLDLGLKVKDKPSQKPQPAVQPALPGDADPDGDEDRPRPAGRGGVSVDLDRITRPGAVVSGSAVFSDGKRVQWLLDQYGRLALDAGSSGYRPSQQDLAAFQRELQALLAQRGL